MLVFLIFSWFWQGNFVFKHESFRNLASNYYEIQDALNYCFWTFEAETVLFQSMFNGKVDSNFVNTTQYFKTNIFSKVSYEKLFSASLYWSLATDDTFISNIVSQILSQGSVLIFSCFIYKGTNCHWYQQEIFITFLRILCCSAVEKWMHTDEVHRY